MGEIGICNRIENRNGQCRNEELTHFNNEAQRVETINDSCVRHTELRTGYGTLDTITYLFSINHWLCGMLRKVIEITIG